MADLDSPQLTEAGFAALMAPYGPLSQLAIGVSGGPDSMALLALAERWGKSADCKIVALTVDHRLRPEAADEAAGVAAWCAQRDIPHDTLVWHHSADEQTGNVQANAREARYRLMGRWCAARGIKALAVAHHADDQAETLVMRLKRGSGVDGLAAMAAQVAWPVSLDEAPRLIRPLLGVSKQALADVAQAERLPVIHDPSNEDTRFERVHARAAIQQLGLDTERLNRTAALMAQEKSVLDWATRQALGLSAHLSPHGFVDVDILAYRRFPTALGMRLLRCIIKGVSGAAYPPRRDALEKLHQAIIGGQSSVLSGLQFCAAADKVYIVPEHLPPMREISLNLAQWDSRFSFAATEAGWRVWARGDLAGSALGDEVLGLLGGLPTAVRACVPVAQGPDDAYYLPTFGQGANQLSVHNYVLERL